MLHLIFQSSIDSALLQRIDRGDDVVFLENALFRMHKGASLRGEFQQMLKNRVYLYVLAGELETRGIKEDELLLGVEVIGFSGFVELTEKNKVVRTWN